MTCLRVADRDGYSQIGITDPEGQKKILCTTEQMHLDKVDLDTMTPLNNIDSGSEDFLNFLISLKQQCCYLTETVQDIISRFPRSPSKVVLTCDPKKEVQAICTELVTQTGDPQKELVCLKTLLVKTMHFSVIINCETAQQQEGSRHREAGFLLAQLGNLCELTR
ncbi:ankyrin repeat, SAM and basic leucine zipper domain-containing protein 1-like [Myxocyprinus asiaticus]|uniref:ankyrin repeat, SAM and basic leucine zipper domain-containing protein 1-like n=1 Tax=Myxocyprinus asiaticus TaxID=70543 RepID=UPI0022235B06|nr:ankyrin repeat, SAM and basic leucine zipper domain-containing protein 1-like [Myxocyprinus asiaticus]